MESESVNSKNMNISWKVIKNQGLNEGGETKYWIGKRYNLIKRLRDLTKPHGELII